MGKRGTSKATAEATPSTGKAFDSELDALFAAASSGIPQPAASAAPASKRPRHDSDAASTSKSIKKPRAAASATESEDDVPVFSDSDEDEEDEDEDAPPPLHETVTAAAAAAGKAKQQSSRQTNGTDTDAREKADRTIYIGNVPLSTLTSKSQRKQLLAHLRLHSPWPSVTKLSALRFRSVPLAVPTADYAASTPVEAQASAKRRQRARVWEGKKFGDGHAHAFQTPAQKRKVAYINSELNTQAHQVNAYLTVLQPTQRDLAALKAPPGTAELLTPRVLAAFVAACADGSSFGGRHLRTDVEAPLPQAEREAAALTVPLPNGQHLGVPRSDDIDAPTSVFVGNLDFAANEEALWEWTDAILTKERGAPPEWEQLDMAKFKRLPPPQARSAEQAQEASDDDDDDDDSDDSEDEDEQDEQSEANDKAEANDKCVVTSFPPAPQRTASWLRSIRFVRDPATQMGKGIGYIRFVDTACVDELLALAAADAAFLSTKKPGGGRTAAASQATARGEQQYKRKLKFQGRPLRVDRCKRRGRAQSTARGASQQTKASPARRDGAKATATSSAPSRTPAAVTKPRTSSTAAPPAAAAPVVTHSPEKAARIAAKRADPERQAKRTAKKERRTAAAKEAKRLPGVGTDTALTGKVRLEQKKAKVGAKAKPGMGRKSGGKQGGASSSKEAATGKGRRS